jgi:hypothetical protein
MQQTEFLSGYSELKDLLVEHYGHDRKKLRLYFSQTKNSLLMHDYNNHKNVVELVLNFEIPAFNRYLKPRAKKLVLNALRQNEPAKYLNDGFLLYGFFRV